MLYYHACLALFWCFIFCIFLTIFTNMLPGSEMYQEALIKALAKHFDARLLILDSLLLCDVSYTLAPLLICIITTFTILFDCSMWQQKYVNYWLNDNYMQTTSKFQESLKDARRDDAPTSTSGTDTVRISSNNTFREGYYALF